MLTLDFSGVGVGGHMPISGLLCKSNNFAIPVERGLEFDPCMNAPPSRFAHMSCTIVHYFCVYNV